MPPPADGNRNRPDSQDEPPPETGTPQPVVFIRKMNHRPVSGIGLETWGLGFGVSAKRPFHEGLISTSPFPLSTSSFVLKSCPSKYASVFVGTYVELCRDLRRHARPRLNLNLDFNLNLALYPAPNREPFISRVG